jgi:hypothetical protein
MVLPVQATRGVEGDPDAELAFGLRDRGAGVTWILPRTLDQALERSPGLDTRTRGLAVGTFTAAEVRRIGDPLYGELRRLATVVDAGVALIPVYAMGVETEDGLRAVRFSAAVLHVQSGRVLWFGVVEGDPFPVGDPRGLASGVDELARTLLWYGVG